VLIPFGIRPAWWLRFGSDLPLFATPPGLDLGENPNSATTQEALRGSCLRPVRPRVPYNLKLVHRRRSSVDEGAAESQRKRRKRTRTSSTWVSSPLGRQGGSDERPVIIHIVVPDWPLRFCNRSKRPPMLSRWYVQ
jgi:hypothetical protein